MHQGKRKTHEGEASRRVFLAGFLFLLMVLASGVCSSAFAFNIPTGCEDWSLRWDNTVRYTLQQRLHGQENKLISDFQADDGDRNFDVGVVQNRFDLFSEADLIYKGSYGVRVSGAFWYDQVPSDDFDRENSPTSNHFEHGVPVSGLSGFADRYFAGPAGELLDAFVFGKFDVGNVPIYLKAGRHTVYWGEILLSPLNGLNFTQAPLDLTKAFAQPGVEVKEIFRPLNQLSAVAQVSNELTLAAQWYMQWERNVVPEDGTYLSAGDFFMRGSQAILLAPGVPLPHGHDLTPEGFHDFGVSARWSPEFLHGGTLGFYVRNTSDRLPQAILDFDAFEYRFAYAEDIQIYGISYSNLLFGGSLGAEVSFRHDMPLRSDSVVIFDSDDLPDDGELLGTRGDTLHATLNYLQLLKRTPMWDAGKYIIELNYSRWLSVTQGDDYFKGRSHYNTIDAVDKDAMQVAVNFEPQWLQVLPGVDITVPLSVNYGLFGVAAETNNGARGEGMWGIALFFDIFTKYKVRLDYIDYFGKVELIDGTIYNRNGRGEGTAGLRDRDCVVLTLKTSF